MTEVAPTLGRIPRLPNRIPVLPIRSTVVFPTGATALQIGFAANVEALAAHPEPELLVATVSTRDDADPLDPATLEKIAVATRVLDRLNLPGGTIQTTLQGLARIRLSEVRFEHDFYTARPEPVAEEPADEARAQELIEQILNTLAGVAARVDRVPDEVPRILRMNLTDPSRFADLAATLSHFNVADRDAVLQELNVEQRLRYVLARVEEAWERVQEIVDDGAKGEASQPLTPDAIRKRIRALQARLGERDPAEREADEMLRRIDLAQLPPRVAAVARKEADRLRSTTVGTAEAAEVRGYLDTLLATPWNRSVASPTLNLAAVRRALDEDHVGLDDVKRKLMEVLSVNALRGDLRGPIPCLTGPAGVGKTSLAAAVARGLGRLLARLELGGRGESQLAGTRRARNGGSLGKLMGAISGAEARDPVLLLQELDEIGLGNVEGDPVEVVEEFLDPDPPFEFVDRYLDVAFDRSEVFVIGVASDFFRIPRDLRERFVEVRIAGYTPEEKVEIARRELLPRLVREHGLAPEDVVADDDALLFLARGYSRDAGLGSLERALSTILRYAARLHAEGRTEPWTLNPERIEEALGYPRYVPTPAESAPEVGVVTGLAWTAGGGELLFIEALKMPGSGRLIITGLLGEVMRESVDAGFSYVRSRAEALRIPNDAFGNFDVHVHFPVGATPKDGPSAGAAVTLAIASSLSERPVRHDIAMTGEVTLRGRILDIGGVKEKILAAYRAGLREVILPSGNLRDLRDVPEDVRNGMRFHAVERMDQVFDLALLPPAVVEHRERGNAVGAAAGRDRKVAAGMKRNRS